MIKFASASRNERKILNVSLVQFEIATLAEN